MPPTAIFPVMASLAPSRVAERVGWVLSATEYPELDEHKALARLENIIGKEPGNVNAHYMTGLLKLRKGDKAAVAHLQTVLEKDPQDAYVAYFLGQALEQQGKNDEALALYEQTMQTDPYLRSAYYAAFLIHRRAGERDRAKELLGIYERLATNPRAQLAEYKYTRMGRKAEVLVVEEKRGIIESQFKEYFYDWPGDKPHKMVVDGEVHDMTDAVVENYRANKLDALVCLGGGGTQKNALRLARRGLNIITLPKTIDNDIMGTDVTFGFDTALGVAVDAIDRLHSTASSHHRIIIVEIMGHRVGWLALGEPSSSRSCGMPLPRI